VYPRRLPAATDLFRLEDVVDGAIGLLRDLPQPTLTYLHFFPPHGFYRPKGKYNKYFMDDWQATHKPAHPLINDPTPFESQENQRRRYDQYLASWDAEVARLFDFMRTSGLLDTSYVIITSDHGEIFERGHVGHSTPLIFGPLVHVPLIISRPGQTSRIDVRAPTSSVDLLPTIAALSGLDVPPWAEGQLLPELGGTPREDRSIYVLDAKTNSAFGKLTKLSLSLSQGEYRLTYYQYPNRDYQDFELYHLAADPDELNNIYSDDLPVAARLKDELLQKLSEVNRGYDP
jgi:arylsulfatase A-like enzyme